jgi:group I intron endonuclease
MIKYIVYITINLCNGKFYIGVHKTNPDVFDGYIGCGVYKNKNDNTYPFQKAVKKYGYENFKRTTLAVFETENEAYLLEEQIVTKTLIRSKYCYNATTGGKHSPPHEGKKVYKYALNGEYLRSFQSIRAAAQNLDINNWQNISDQISMNCSGRANSAHGFYWSFTKEFKYIRNINSKKIAQYTLSGKFLKYFDSIAELEFELGVSDVTNTIKRKGTSKGFQFRYYENDNSDILPKKSYDNKKEKDILVFDEYDKLIGEYETIKICCEQNSQFKRSGIYNVLCGLNKTYKRHKFKYKNDDIV